MFSMTRTSLDFKTMLYLAAAIMVGGANLLVV
jgi:hypothetical protein